MEVNLTFIGDIMLGRMIGSTYLISPYKIVAENLQAICENSDLTIANLESPITVTKNEIKDHLQFVGNADTLSELKWIDVFSLANNHICDIGEVGMDETMAILERNGFSYNGLFPIASDYEALIADIKGQKIAMLTVTDMMNVPFPEDSKWQCLRVGEQRINDIIKCLKNKGLMVIVYAHIGALFTRYPNYTSFNYLHTYVDSGADCIVTVHSHCLGGMEYYKGVPIFHSLGDFIMDGNSFRRRRSAMLTLTIEQNKVKTWKLTPAEINQAYETVEPSEKTKVKMLRSFEMVSENIKKHSGDYQRFYKWQYKKEMFAHTLSTLSYLLHTRGIFGMFRLLFLRFEEVGRMFKWMATDRSKVQRDDDAIKSNRKKFSQEQIFGKR